MIGLGAIGRQVALQLAAIGCSTGREEGGLEIRSLIKTKTPKLEFHRYEPRNKGHFRRLFAVVRAYLDDLDTGRFVFRPGLGCAMCDYRDDHCRSWEA